MQKLPFGEIDVFSGAGWIADGLTGVGGSGGWLAGYRR